MDFLALTSSTPTPSFNAIFCNLSVADTYGRLVETKIADFSNGREILIDFYSFSDGEVERLAENNQWFDISILDCKEDIDFGNRYSFREFNYRSDPSFFTYKPSYQDVGQNTFDDFYYSNRTVNIRLSKSLPNFSPDYYQFTFKSVAQFFTEMILLFCLLWGNTFILQKNLIDQQHTPQSSRLLLTYENADKGSSDSSLEKEKKSAELEYYHMIETASSQIDTSCNYDTESESGESFSSTSDVTNHSYSNYQTSDFEDISMASSTSPSVPHSLSSFIHGFYEKMACKQNIKPSLNQKQRERVKHKPERIRLVHRRKSDLPLSLDDIEIAFLAECKELSAVVLEGQDGKIAIDNTSESGSFLSSNRTAQDYSSDDTLLSSDPFGDWDEEREEEEGELLMGSIEDIIKSSEITVETSFGQDLNFGDIYPMPLEDILSPSKWQSVKDMPRVNRMPFSSKTPRLIPPKFKKKLLDGIQSDLSNSSRLWKNDNIKNDRKCDENFNTLSDFTTERNDEDVYEIKSHQSEVYGYGNEDLTEDNTGDDSDSDNDLCGFYTVEQNTLSSTSMGYMSSKNHITESAMEVSRRYDA